MARKHQSCVLTSQQVSPGTQNGKQNEERPVFFLFFAYILKMMNHYIKNGTIHFFRICYSLGYIRLPILLCKKICLTFLINFSLYFLCRLFEKKVLTKEVVENTNIYSILYLKLVKGQNNLKILCSLFQYVYLPLNTFHTSKNHQVGTYKKYNI